MQILDFEKPAEQSVGSVAHEEVGLKQGVLPARILKEISALRVQRSQQANVLGETGLQERNVLFELLFLKKRTGRSKESKELQHVQTPLVNE